MATWIRTVQVITLKFSETNLSKEERNHSVSKTDCVSCWETVSAGHESMGWTMDIGAVLHPTTCGQETPVLVQSM